MASAAHRGQGEMMGGTAPMRVLFVTSEAAPLVKTGGLADVSAALPAALNKLGVDVRVLLPGYPAAMTALGDFQFVTRFPGFPGLPAANLLEGKLPSGVPVYLIDCPELYRRNGGLYQDAHGRDWNDNAERFGLLSRIGAVMGSAESPIQWRPNVVHCNDWQAGLTPAYLRYSRAPAPSVMTVHNLAFQGVFSAHLTEQLGLPRGSFQPEGVEYHGHLSFLKAGLHYAQHITTVSPSYAVEIQDEAMGFGMQGLLHARRHHLTGILNGIDDEEWNPEIDKRIAERYGAATVGKKILNKRALQARLGLDEREDVPLFAMVGRFAYQKGVDLIMQIAPQLVELPAQVALLGTGEAELQQVALSLVRRHAGQIAGVIGFDEDLSHLYEAGADIFLMPSRFEPCGLNQMYSQRYGTPPIVNPTGGLIDTVTDCNEANLANGSATGFVVEGPLHAGSLLDACRRAARTWHDKKAWRALQKNGMTRDFSWAHSAAAYLEIYARLARGQHA